MLGVFHSSSCPSYAAQLVAVMRMLQRRRQARLPVYRVVKEWGFAFAALIVCAKPSAATVPSCLAAAHAGHAVLQLGMRCRITCE